MPNVVSKLVNKTTETYTSLNLPKHVVTSSIVGLTLFLYGAKLSYPLIEKYIYVENNQNAKLENNNYANKTTSTTTVAANGDVNLHNGKIMAKKKIQPGLNYQFLMQFLKLIKIMIPGVFCQETALLSVHTLCLVIRTFLSIYVASMEGAIVKHIVRRDINNFFLMLIKWFAIALPATGVNSLIRYLENKLAISFR